MPQVHLGLCSKRTNNISPLSQIPTKKHVKSKSKSLLLINTPYLLISNQELDIEIAKAQIQSNINIIICKK